MGVFSNLGILPHYIYVSLQVSSTIYGINLVVFSLLLYILAPKHRWATINRFILISSCFTFLLATGNIISAGIYGHEVLVDDIPAASIIPFLLSANPTALASGLLYALAVGLQDIIVAWRAYIVWQKARWILWLSVFILGSRFVLLIYSLAIYGLWLHHRAPAKYLLTLDPVVQAAFLNGIAFNIMTVTLISGRILWQSRHFRGSRFGRAARVIVESGLLYTGGAIVTFALYLDGMKLGPAMFFVLSQLATLSPLLINVRMALSTSKFAPPGQAQDHVRFAGGEGSGMSTVPITNVLYQGSPAERSEKGSSDQGHGAGTEPRETA